MRKFYCFLFISLNFFILSKAQNNIEFGIKAGLNKGLLIGLSEKEEAKTPVGAHIAGFTIIPLSEKITFQPELSFYLLPMEFTVDSQLDFLGEQITVPMKIDGTGKVLGLHLLTAYELSDKFKIGLAPQISYLANRDYNLIANYQGITIENPEIIELKEEIYFWELALGLDTAYRISPHWQANARFTYGLTKVRRDEDSDAKTSILFLSLGYIF